LCSCFYKPSSIHLSFELKSIKLDSAISAAPYPCLTSPTAAPSPSSFAAVTGDLDDGEEALPNLVVDPEAAAFGLQAEDELYPGVRRGSLYSRVVGEDDRFYVGYDKFGALTTIPESSEVEYLGKLSPEMDRRRWRLERAKRVVHWA
ncbi:uncharacterized protein LOC130137318, partial [Syzygium oleosum]|uniref:uncharacterized protein LOC130137318 n=1 Tax=Syzygium oleosum TaxID=219896 RepID=UPI0024B9D8FE